MGKIKSLKIGGGSGGGSVDPDLIILDKDFPVVLSGGKTFGRYANGTTIPAIGKTLNQFLDDVMTEYLLPTFASFTINYPSTTLEIGTNIGGSRIGTWSTTNSANIDLVGNAIQIINVTGGNAILTSTQVNSGTDSFIVASANITGSGWSFRIQATNTQSTVFSRLFSLSGSYRIFFAPVSTIPTTSAQVRAFVGTSIFNTGTTTFTLNTGTTEVNFMFAIPNTAGAGNTRTLTSVIDLDAANANLTSSYLLTTFNVDDANGVGVSYKVYSLTIAVPYSSNHRHQITIS